MPTLSLRPPVNICAACFCLFSCLMAINPEQAIAGEQKQIIGYVEKVYLYPGKLKFKVKIDTGAKTSSLGVNDLERFKREGEQWVRFSLSGYEGKTSFFELPIERRARIRRAEADRDVRPVVRLGICLGSTFKEAEVNLNNRKGMNYRMLIGRRFLGNHFLVDPKAKFLTKPSCKRRRTR